MKNRNEANWQEEDERTKSVLQGYGQGKRVSVVISIYEAVGAVKNNIFSQVSNGNVLTFSILLAKHYNGFEIISKRSGKVQRNKNIVK